MKDTRKRVLRAKNGSQQIVVEREITVGRDTGCDEVLSKGQTSRRHATLSPDEGGVLVTDLNSTNGTYINGRRVQGSELAKNGDEIRFDTEAFTLSVSDLNTGDATMIRPLKIDATVLRAAVTPPAKKAAQASAAAAASRSRPESQAVTQPRPLQKAPQSEQKVAPKRENTPPPSWALNRQQSVDGTQILSDSMISSIAAVVSNKVENEEVTVPTLIGQNDPIKGMRFQMVAESGADGINQWTVGRSDHADIMINHNSVSTQHAQIINEGARWKLVDMMSANGTYVNGTKGLTSYLQSGDTIKFGQVEARFMLGGDQAVAASARRGAAQSAGRSSPLKLAIVSFAVTAVVIIAAVFLVG